MLSTHLPNFFFVAILKKLGEPTSPTLPVDCPYTLALSLGQITESVMGGSSGAVSRTISTLGASTDYFVHFKDISLLIIIYLKSFLN